MIRPCSRAACHEVYLTDLESREVPVVKVYVADNYLHYCCPRCASVDLTERFYPAVLP